MKPLAPSGAIACEMSAPLKRISLTRPPAEFGAKVPTLISTPGNYGGATGPGCSAASVAQLGADDVLVAEAEPGARRGRRECNRRSSASTSRPPWQVAQLKPGSDQAGGAEQACGLPALRVGRRNRRSRGAHLARDPRGDGVLPRIAAAHCGRAGSSSRRAASTRARPRRAAAEVAARDPAAARRARRAGDRAVVGDGVFEDASSDRAPAPSTPPMT